MWTLGVSQTFCSEIITVHLLTVKTFLMELQCQLIKVTPKLHLLTLMFFLRITKKQFLVYTMKVRGVQCCFAPQ